MATTKNIHVDPCNFDGETKLLLDGFISVLSNAEHMFISDNDMLIYVHEKSHCYNICKLAAVVKCEKGKQA